MINNLIKLKMVDQADYEHQLSIHITGFGEFGGRKDNPTTDLVNEVDSLLLANPV
jgi:hypothetical protein